MRTCDSQRGVTHQLLPLEVKEGEEGDSHSSLSTGTKAAGHPPAPGRSLQLAESSRGLKEVIYLWNGEPAPRHECLCQRPVSSGWEEGVSPPGSPTVWPWPSPSQEPLRARALGKLLQRVSKPCLLFSGHCSQRGGRNHSGSHEGRWRASSCHVSSGCRSKTPPAQSRRGHRPTEKPRVRNTPASQACLKMRLRAQSNRTAGRALALHLADRVPSPAPRRSPEPCQE